MEREQIIYSAINQINWDVVLYNVKQLNLRTKPTKNKLVEELTEILNNVIIAEKKFLVTDLWTITYDQIAEEGFTLEVVFTSIIIWVDTVNKVKDKVNRLEQRLKLAVEIEDYEKASKIKKSLEKLITKLK